MYIQYILSFSQSQTKKSVPNLYHLIKSAFPKERWGTSRRRLPSEFFIPSVHSTCSESSWLAYPPFSGFYIFFLYGVPMKGT